jgi:hypothetical protein
VFGLASAEKTNNQGPDKHPARTLLYCISVGAAFFTGLFLLLYLALVHSGKAPDPSVFRFYPIMAGLGLIFGFERWWAYEQGGVNPFHNESSFQ